ncbi:MAG: efflux RND transporter periplasmic adaptor subunit [Cetobacterium sp.]|uniref:efflux RND transporter periplasmic adaptor subunit n=1 Tax=unclassified Cetobacterium TaxID=2630983 RepID=UPI00163C5704|nr:efflux RND transporter periplasmic adaptor subunit [Cetobacterium sp. 2A]MBC2856551.1 efflux RND transporter periplasmic adaptor subunit [Cetobacterium sp. 2A]
MKKYLYLVLVAGMAFTACGKKSNTDEKVEIIPKNVVVESVKLNDISDIYKSDATIVPADKVNHSLDGIGTVKKVYKKNGEAVDKGEVVVVMTDSKTESDYSRAKANLASAKSNLAIATNNYKKHKSLYEKEMVSELEFLDYKNRFIDAEGNHEAKKAEFENAKDKYEKLTRKAETSGVVGNLYLKPGNEVKEKENLFTVVNEQEMEVIVDFPGKWFNRVTIGSPAYVEISDLGKKELKGYIKEINPVATPETRKFPVTIRIPNLSGNMKDGMYGKVNIPAGKRETLVVPQEAVFVRDLLSYVFIVEDSKAKRVEVKTGAIEEPMIEITTDNLKPGNEVIVEGLFGLEDGDLINIEKK